MSYAQKAGCARAYTQAQHSRYTRAVYARASVSEKARKRVLRLRRCQLTAKAAVNARRLTRRLRERYEERRQIAAVTPYDCGSAGHFAIPCSIVECESHFDINADNGSHRGYYQLDYSYLSDWSASSQHAKAASMWQGGAGASHWAQCLVR